jgi:hypothetical protein
MAFSWQPMHEGVAVETTGGGCEAISAPEGSDRQ